MLKEIKKYDGGKLPEKMKNARRWLLWRRERDGAESERELKVPYYVSGKKRYGKLDTPEDLSRLATFEEATFAEAQGNYDGLGFALGKDGEGYWQGIDLDDVKGHDNDELSRILPGYVESSPSGDGVHAIGYGEPFRSKNRSREKGWEYYSQGKYFTFTGRVKRNGKLTDLKSFIKEYIDDTVSDIPVNASINRSMLIFSEPQIGAIQHALKYIDSDCSYQKWTDVAFSLTRVECGFELWREWSLRSNAINYKKSGDKELEDKWYHDILPTSEGRRNVSSIFYDAQLNPKYEDSESELVSDIKQLVHTDERRNSILKELTNFYSFDADNLPGSDWLIDDLIPEGPCTFYGDKGVGKSTTLLPIAMRIAGLINSKEGEFLHCHNERTVIWLTEAPKQISRLIYGVAEHQCGHLSRREVEEKINENFKFRDSRKITTDEVVYLAEAYKEYGDENGVGPLIVFDTASSNFSFEDNNSDSAVSKMIAELKTKLFIERNMSLWIIGHVAKATANSNGQGMSFKGAGAYENDSYESFPLYRCELTGRTLFRPTKKRDGQRIKEVAATVEPHYVMAQTTFGKPRTLSTYYTTVTYEESDPEIRAAQILQNKTTDVERKVSDAVLHLNSHGLKWATVTQIVNHLKEIGTNPIISRAKVDECVKSLSDEKRGLLIFKQMTPSNGGQLFKGYQSKTYKNEQDNHNDDELDEGE